MQKNSKIVLSTDSTYEELVELVRLKGTREGKLQELSNIYTAFKDVVEKDIVKRNIIIKLRKEIDLPLRNNKTGSSKYAEKLGKGINRSKRKKYEKNSANDMALNNERFARMKSMFSLDPENINDREAYGMYLSSKEDLSKAEKKVLLNAFREESTKESITRALAQIKSASKSRA